MPVTAWGPFIPGYCVVAFHADVAVRSSSFAELKKRSGHSPAFIVVLPKCWVDLVARSCALGCITPSSSSN